MDPAVSVSTVVRPHEDPKKVTKSVQALFPDWSPEANPDGCCFPCTRGELELKGPATSLDTVLKIVREQRVLDTALDAMAMSLIGKSTVFSLSRQSALAGKVSFVLKDYPLGGTMEVMVEGRDLGSWLEQQTWHSGRGSIPRSTGDELAMTEEGDPSEWFDSKGRKTIGDMD